MKDKNPGGRPASVTPEQVFDAANEVVNRGDSPNFASVFALVNGGTRGYINKHLMAWDIACEKSGNLRFLWRSWSCIKKLTPKANILSLQSMQLL